MFGVTEASLYPPPMTGRPSNWMSFVQARPPLTPMADHWRLPSTPIPKELVPVVSVAAALGTGLDNAIFCASEVQGFVG